MWYLIGALVGVVLSVFIFIPMIDKHFKKREMDIMEEYKRKLEELDNENRE